MRSSFYVATAKTAFLFTFGFAMSCVIAPSVVHANVIINHLGVFAHNNPDAEQGIDGGTVTAPVEPTPGPDGPPDDSVQLGLGGNDGPRIKPSTFVAVTTFRLFTETHTLTDPPQLGSEFYLPVNPPSDPVSVPEPGTLGLLAAAFAALGLIRRKV